MKHDIYSLETWSNHITIIKLVTYRVKCYFTSGLTDTVNAHNIHDNANNRRGIYIWVQFIWNYHNKIIIT